MLFLGHNLIWISSFDKIARADHSWRIPTNTQANPPRNSHLSFFFPCLFGPPSSRFIHVIVTLNHLTPRSGITIFPKFCYKFSPDFARERFCSLAFQVVELADSSNYRYIRHPHWPKRGRRKTITSSRDSSSRADAHVRNSRKIPLNDLLYRDLLSVRWCFGVPRRHLPSFSEDIAVHLFTCRARKDKNNPVNNLRFSLRPNCPSEEVHHRDT